MADSPAIVHQFDRGAPVQAAAAPALGVLLARDLDSSPALIYLKDADGRYVHVNRRYCRVMSVSAETLLGRADLELPAAATIDGPRLRRDHEPTPEPLQLEYVVGAFGDRPALSVMRFAVLDRAGVQVGTCGVAAPLDEAALARAACTELIAVAECSEGAGLAPAAALPPDPGPVALTPAEPAGPSEGELELREELVEREHELIEVRGALRVARDELEELRHERERGDRAEADLVQERDRAERAEAALAEMRERADPAAAALSQERERAVRAEAALSAAREELETSCNETAVLRQRLAEAEQRFESALQSSAAELANSLREHEQTELTLGQERERAEADLAQERGRAERAEAALAEMRGRAESALSEERERGEAALIQLQADRERLTRALSAERDELEASRTQAAVLRDGLAEAEQRVESTLQSCAAEIADLVREQEEARAAQTEEHEQARAAQAEAYERARAAEHEQAELKLGQERERADCAEADLARERDRAERAEAALSEAGDAARRVVDVPAPVTRIEPPEVDARPGPGGPRWSSAAQRALAAALARASDWNLTLRDAVKVLGAEGGWDAVCAWSPDVRVQRLRCTAMWTDPVRELGKFETSTWQQLPSLEGTLLGRALGDVRLTWLSPEDPDGDRRVAAARREGLVSGVLVPIHDGATPVALLELLTRLSAAPSDELSAALEATALQLAHLCHLARLGAEPRWAFGRF